MMNKHDVTIVFCTCDAYADLWENFFILLEKYWPECSAEIILNTETKSFQYKHFRISEPLNCAKNISWSDRLSISLKRVKTPYVLMMLDDFYLKAPVDHGRFLETLEYMKSNPGVASITYLKEPGIRKSRLDLPGFNDRSQFSLYKMTAHITLYRKDYLQSILKKDETAWEFEVNGTIRSWFRKGSFLCPPNNMRAVFPYDYGSLCVRGRYYGPVKRYFEEWENFSFDTCRETIESLPQHNGASTVKKINYLLKGLLSLFKENI